MWAIFSIISAANKAELGLKVAHVRLCGSHTLFVWANPRESQEMDGFDAHNRAVAD